MSLKFKQGLLHQEAAATIWNEFLKASAPELLPFCQQAFAWEMKPRPFTRLQESEQSQRLRQQALERCLAPSHSKSGISHSLGAAFSIAFPSSASLGVDLEKSSRVISPTVQKRYCGESTLLQLSPIAVWCIKEACYKANPRATETTISDYTVHTQSQARCEQTQGLFKWMVFSFEDWTLAFAVLDPKAPSYS